MLGASEGFLLGATDGDLDGNGLGAKEGTLVGELVIVGPTLGAAETGVVGSDVGALVGGQKSV